MRVNARQRIAATLAALLCTSLLVAAPHTSVHASLPAATSGQGNTALTSRWASNPFASAEIPPAPAPVGKPLTRLSTRGSASTVSKQPALVKRSKPTVRAATVLTAPACVNQPLAAGNALSISDAGVQFDPWAWGADYRNGSSGTGDLVPSPVPGPSTLSAVSTQDSTMLQIVDGTVWGWGFNNRGQLGLGESPSQLAPTQWAPVQVVNLTNVIAIGSGAYHSMALRSDGTLWVWGDNTYGELGSTAPSNPAIATVPQVVFGRGGLRLEMRSPRITPARQRSSFRRPLWSRRWLPEPSTFWRSIRVANSGHGVRTSTASWETAARIQPSHPRRRSQD